MSEQAIDTWCGQARIDAGIETGRRPNRLNSRQRGVALELETELAILLAQRGHSVVVLERFPAPHPLPRAVHFDHEVARVLQAAGIEGDLAGFAEFAPIFERRNAAGEILLRFGRENESGLSDWPDAIMSHQPSSRAPSKCASARSRTCGCCVAMMRVVLNDAGDAVVLGARSEQGEPLEVRARFAVGCDGANSFERGAIGAELHDLGFAFDCLVVDVIPHESRIWSPLNRQLCDPARPTALRVDAPAPRVARGAE